MAVLGTEVATDDLEHHHQGDTKARSMEEPEDPGPPPKHTTMKTTKKRWGRRALLTGFALRQYPRVSNYLMINKNMMDLRNPNHGSRITYKQRKYWEEQSKQQCKACNYTSPAQQGHG
jgi:hypothetical protein